MGEVSQPNHKLYIMGKVMNLKANGNLYLWGENIHLNIIDNKISMDKFLNGGIENNNIIYQVQNGQVIYNTSTLNKLVRPYTQCVQCAEGEMCDFPYPYNIIPDESDEKEYPSKHVHGLSRSRKLSENVASCTSCPALYLDNFKSETYVANVNEK